MLNTCTLDHQNGTLKYLPSMYNSIQLIKCEHMTDAVMEISDLTASSSASVEVCLSVRTFMNDNLQNVVLIYREPLIVDCSVEDMFHAPLCIP